VYRYFIKRVIQGETLGSVCVCARTCMYVCMNHETTRGVEQVKGKVKLSLGLTVYHAMKMYPVL